MNQPVDTETDGTESGWSWMNIQLRQEANVSPPNIDSKIKPC